MLSFLCNASFNSVNIKNLFSIPPKSASLVHAFFRSKIEFGELTIGFSIVRKQQNLSWFFQCVQDHREIMAACRPCSFRSASRLEDSWRSLLHVCSSFPPKCSAWFAYVFQGRKREIRIATSIIFYPSIQTNHCGSVLSLCTQMPPSAAISQDGYMREMLYQFF